MGFFDKIFSKKDSAEENPAPAASSLPLSELATAAAHLASGRTAEGIAIHESLVAAQPDSGELLAAISADLGRNGALAEMVSLVAPIFDAAIHGPEAGINLIQAYIRLGQPDGAQMMIDVLSGLDRPELADRLAGFEIAVEELRASGPAASEPASPVSDDSRVNLVSISKPLWSYALPEGDSLLPGKEGRLRIIAILPFGASDAAGVQLDPDHAVCTWARAFPFAISEALAFAPSWKSRATIGIAPGDKPFTPPRGLGVEQVRGLFGGGSDAADFVVTGGLVVAGDILSVRLEVIDVRKSRSIKTMTDSCPVARADMALTAVFMHLRQYLEATETLPGPLEYAPPGALTAHLVALDHALAFFLVEKKVVGRGFLGDAEARATALDAHAASAKDPLAPLIARAARITLSKLQDS